LALITSPLATCGIKERKYRNSTSGTSDESTASLPLKYFPAKTRKMEKIKPKSIAESIGNVQITGKTNIAGKTEDLNPWKLFTTT
jgi:hypothetical protein